MHKIRIQTWLGGMQTLTGGTRTEVKLNRPWQLELTVDEKSCLFCMKDQKALAEHGEWLELSNIFAPYSFHHLIIFRTCWPVDWIRCLGRELKITEALKVAEGIVTEQGREFMLVSIHVGWLAGQNLPHLYYYVLDNNLSNFERVDAATEIRDISSNSELFVFEH